MLNWYLQQALSFASRTYTSYVGEARNIDISIHSEMIEGTAAAPPVDAVGYERSSRSVVASSNLGSSDRRCEVFCFKSVLASRQFTVGAFLGRLIDYIVGQDKLM